MARLSRLVIGACGTLCLSLALYDAREEGSGDLSIEYERAQRANRPARTQPRVICPLCERSLPEHVGFVPFHLANPSRHSLDPHGCPASDLTLERAQRLARERRSDDLR